MSEKRSTVIGVFEDLQSAAAAVEDLHQNDFDGERVGIIVREIEHAKEPDDEMKVYRKAESTAGERTAEGALAGGFAGGVLGAMASLVIPGMGPILAAGFLAAGGAIVGGFSAIMSTVELPEEEVRWYEAEFEAGRPIVFVRTDGRYSEALAILQTHGAYDMTRKREQ